MDDPNKRRRLDDFRGVRAKSEFLLRHQSRRWEYVPIHPFSDELQLLQKLETLPSHCTAVDAYWLLDDDAYFVQVMTTGFAHQRTPGYYARCAAGDPPMVYLSVVVDAPTISRAVFEAALSTLVDRFRVQQLACSGLSDSPQELK